MGIGLTNARKRLLQAILPALRLLPTRAAIRLVARLGEAEYALNPPLRARFGEAVRRGAAHFGCRWDVPRTARRLAGNHLRWHARDQLLDGLSDAQADAILRVEGRANLDAAIAMGRGVVLLFNHFGPFLMPAHWLVRHGYPLRWFTERPRHISKLVASTFGTDGPLGQRELFISRKLSPNEGGAAIRRAVRMLRAGMVVQIAGDVRWSGPRCVPGHFLGQDYHFTSTWVTLAARTGAPVLPVFAVMRPDGTYHLEFLPAEVIPPEDASPARATPWVQRNLDRIEGWVRQHPENSLDYLFWAESEPLAPAPVPTDRAA
jgi:KDO2-lipid IV(A) lauroyltransferase